MAEKGHNTFPAWAPCQAAQSVYMFTHVPSQEASLRSWKAMRCHQVLEILKANSLSQDVLVVQMIHGKPEVSWDQLSQSLSDRSSPCLLMSWKCLCLLKPAGGSPNTVPISLKETGSYYWIAPWDGRHYGRVSLLPLAVLFWWKIFITSVQTDKIVSPMKWGANWRLYC